MGSGVVLTLVPPEGYDAVQRWDDTTRTLTVTFSDPEKAKSGGFAFQVGTLPVETDEGIRNRMTRMANDCMDNFVYGPPPTIDDPAAEIDAFFAQRRLRQARITALGGFPPIPSRAGAAG